MGPFVRFIVVSALIGLWSSAVMTPVLADCSGIVCTHYLTIYTSGGLIYNQATSQIDPGTGLDAEEWMTRDVYPYSDELGSGFGNAPCQSQSDIQGKGYGLHAHYGFRGYLSGTRCGGSAALAHWHPYNPSGNYFNIYWTGQYIYCYSTEPPGSMTGTCS